MGCYGCSDSSSVMDYLINDEHEHQDEEEFN
jgi:hypothetical protein